MATGKSRELVKGHLQPPTHSPSTKSYTQPPTSSDEIVIQRQKQKDSSSKVVEFSSRAVPQPFLDPAVMKRRIELAKKSGG